MTGLRFNLSVLEEILPGYSRFEDLFDGEIPNSASA